MYTCLYAGIYLCLYIELCLYFMNVCMDEIVCFIDECLSLRVYII